MPPPRLASLTLGFSCHSLVRPHSCGYSGAQVGSFRSVKSTPIPDHAISSTHHCFCTCALWSSAGVIMRKMRPNIAPPDTRANPLCYLATVRWSWLQRPSLPAASGPLLCVLLGRHSWSHPSTLRGRGLRCHRGVWCVCRHHLHVRHHPAAGGRGRLVATTCPASREAGAVCKSCPALLRTTRTLEGGGRQAAEGWDHRGVWMPQPLNNHTLEACGILYDMPCALCVPEIYGLHSFRAPSAA